MTMKNSNGNDGTTNTITYLLGKARTAPHLILPGILAYLNGYWHKLKFRLLMKDVRIGSGFRVYGKLHVIGPGKVRIGRNCFILGKTLRPVSLVTWRKEAVITLGNNVGLNGAVINCYEEIRIDDLCNIADAYIIDSSAHHISADRRSLPVETVPRAPVHICRNVWISLNVAVLKGVTIGENCVVGAFTLVRRDVPPNKVVTGNPQEIIADVPPTADSE